jgi:hypothetical protein
VCEYTAHIPDPTVWSSQQGIRPLLRGLRGLNKNKHEQVVSARHQALVERVKRAE